MAYRNSGIIEYLGQLTTWIPQPIRHPVRQAVHRLRDWYVSFRIYREQTRLLARMYDRHARKLILVFVPGGFKPGEGGVTGGILALVALCDNTDNLRTIHDAQVAMCSWPGGYPLLKFEWFDNDRMIFQLPQLRRFFPHVDEMILHLPEYISCEFLDVLDPRDLAWLRQLSTLQINIMNMNIKMMPAPEKLTPLARLATKLTISTAHKKYCSLSERQRLGFPLHHMLTPCSEVTYKFRDYAAKENLLIYSPDAHPLKERVLQKLQHLPGIRYVEIQNMTYEQYKEIISRAKWAITFGEGLDGYFLEPIFSGAISFATYNTDFFTPDFQMLDTVYPTYEIMADRLVADLLRLDDPDVYKEYQQKQFRICRSHYDHDTYLQNLKRFYQGNYSFP